MIAELDADPAQELAAELGESALAARCDVTRRADVTAAVATCRERFGRLDALVTCAGLTRDNLVHRMSDEDWDLVIDTHLKGTFLCAQAAQAVMVEQGDGRMVFLSSGSARGHRGQTNYSTAKAGLQGMACTLALELGRFGIRVNTVAPGFIETRMTQSIAQRTGVDYDEVKRAAAARAALGRVGQPEEIASVISFLCGDDSSFMTGRRCTLAAARSCASPASAGLPECADSLWHFWRFPVTGPSAST